MSPPEVWGPAVWTLFHTLIEQMNPASYKAVAPSLFELIVHICKVLPCPDCSRDASRFLAKIQLREYPTHLDFKNMMYLFHNYVNAKKKKPLYNYAHMDKYATLNLGGVVRNFIAKYETRGNMKLMTESFQRTFVVKHLVSWVLKHRAIYIPVIFATPEMVVTEHNTSPSSAEDAPDK